MKKWGPAAIVAASVLVVGSFFIPKDSSSVKEQLVYCFENSIVYFSEASLETKITIDEEVVYVETVNLVKTEEGSSYTSTIKELSDSIFDEELYKTTTSLIPLRGQVFCWHRVVILEQLQHSESDAGGNSQQ